MTEDSEGARSRKRAREGAAYTPPIYHGDEDANVHAAATPPPPATDSEDNRGHRAEAGNGVVKGSGAGAGGSGAPEDYDSAPVAGGGSDPTPVAHGKR